MIKNIPFIQHIGIEEQEKLTLKFTPTIQNHIGTIHAAAQFALAETESGRFLASLFPEYQNQVLPLLRSSSVKYKQPATSNIYAIATIKEEEKKKFEEQFLKRGRATITTSVEVRDSNDTVTMSGEFNWFVQRL